MDILLYNPLSRNGNNPHFIDNIKKHLEQEGKTVKEQNILDVENVESFVAGLNPDDRIILVGGDGTLNQLVNRIYGMKYPQNLYMYQAGTGNDFIRSLETNEKVVFIKPYLEKLPMVEFKEEKKYFLNGAGLGLDGFIIYLMSQSKNKKSKVNYFRHSLRGFVKFKPISGTFTIDGEKYREKKLWFISALNAPYQGGGMKMAPDAKREDDTLQLLVIKDIPKILLFLIFPSIYSGKHVRFKKYVKIYEGKNVHIEFDAPTYLQIDGESKSDVNEITIKAAQ